MNIVVSTKRFLPILGGSIQYAVMLAGEFRKRGHRVTIVTRTAGDAKEAEGCPVLRRPAGRVLLDLAGKTDALLQVDASWRDVWPFLLHRVPWYPTLHFGHPVGKISLRERVELAGLKMAFKMGRPISVGHEVARGWGIRGSVILNPYDDSRFYPPGEHAIRDVDVLFVGRLEESKGILLLVDALETIYSDFPGPLRCVFVGNGIDGERLAERIARAGASLALTMAGRKDPNGVAFWMRRSRVLAFPTTSAWIEASPLTPLEGLACGCRVVATDNGGTRENIGPDGMLVPVDNMLAFADALRTALGQSEPPDSGRTERFLASRRLSKVADTYLELFGG